MATGLDEETCRRVNLEYLDHRTFAYEVMSAESDTSIVKDAGRDLYQVLNGRCVQSSSFNLRIRFQDLQAQAKA